jgi:hypothetical protein
MDDLAIGVVVGLAGRIALKGLSRVVYGRQKTVADQMVCFDLSGRKVLDL